MLEARRMAMNDLDEVMSIEMSSFSVPWTKKDFIESMDKPTALYLVAVENEKVVGYCGLWGVIDEGQINNVAVSKDYRGIGIGTFLMKNLISEGEKMGIVAYTLEVRVHNTAAISLYKKMGFVEAGVRKNYYIAPREDALIMWKYLKDKSTM